MSRATELLMDFAVRDNAAAIMSGIFGDNAAAEAMIAQWSLGSVDFGRIAILPAAQMEGYDGAYGSETDTIYLSQALLDGLNINRIADVLLEEFGHKIDAASSLADTVGDEGAAFAAAVRGEDSVRPAAADVTGSLVIDGELVSVEFATSVSDSGGYEGSSKTLTLENTDGGTITYNYQHYYIPDRFIIRYDGQTLFDTGFTGGASSGSIELPAGDSDKLEVRVVTNDEGTAWYYTVEVSTCPSPDPYIVTSLGNDFVFDADSGKCKTDATVTIGHSKGTDPLLRAQNSTTEHDSSSISVSSATVFATIGGVSDSLFVGDFEISAATGTGDITETGDGTFKLAGMDTEFKSITVLQSSLAFDVAFTLPEEAGGGYLVDTLAILDDALVIDEDGAHFRAGGRLSIPDIIDFKLLNVVQVSASDIALEYRADEDAMRFQGKLELDNISKLESIGKITADLSGDNYVQINSDGRVDLVGALKVETDLGPYKGWSLTEVELTIDTTSSEVGGSATIGMPMGLKIGGPATAKPSLEIHTDPLALDAVGIEIDNLNKPIPAYPLFFFQGLNGKVDNFAPGNDKDIEFSGGLAATFGPQLSGTYLGRLDANVTIDANKVAGTGDLGILNVEFSAFGSDLGTFTALSGTCGVELDWSKGQFTTSGSMNALDGLFTLDTQLRFDTDCNFSSFGTAAIGVPDFVPVFGGTDIANGNYAVSFTNDGDYSNDYVAGWGQVSISKFGIEFDITAGLRANFDGSMDYIGFGNLPPVGSWAVPADQEYVLLTAQWENASADARLVVELPDGKMLSESEFAEHNIAVVEEFSSDTSRTIIIASPPAGVYDVLVEDETGLGTVQYFAIGETEAPSLTIDSVELQSDGTVDIGYYAADPDSTAQVTFWYDDDLTELDGFYIDTVMETDSLGSLTWDANSVVPGSYYVYAMIDDGESVTVIDSFEMPVSVGSETDLGVALEIDDRATGGDVLTVTVNVDNLGASIARNASVLLTLPEALTPVSPLPDNVTVDGDGTLRVQLGDIEEGENASFSLDVTSASVTSDTPVFIDAYVLTDSYDSVTSNDSAVASVVLEPPSTAVIDLAVSQTLVTTAPVVLGDTLSYDIVVSNAGPDTARNSVLTEQIDGLSGVTFSHDASQAADGSYVVELGDIAAGETVTVRVTGTTTVVGSVETFSTVTGDGEETELTIFDNEHQESFAVQGLPPDPADLSVSMSATAPDEDGMSVISVTVSNAGPGVGSNIETLISLPAGLAVTGFSALQGSFDAGTGIWDLGNLRDDLSRTLEIYVDGSEAVGLLDVTAEIIGVDETDPDSTPGNGDPSEDDFASVSLQYANLVGTEGDDRLVGTQRDDVALALGGDDLVHLLNGDDRLEAGAGNDTAFGGSGDDLLRGGEGQDQLFGDDGNDTLSGDSGNDTLNGGKGDNSIDAGDGDDWVRSLAGDDVIGLGSGDDYVMSGSGHDSIDGDDGSDTIFAEHGNDTVNGGAGNDTIFGGRGDNSIDAGDGDDWVQTLSGDDVIVLGNGNDYVRAGSGHDSIDGGDGSDIIFAEHGNDTVTGGAGDDHLFGGRGDDVFVFRPGDGIDNLYSFRSGQDQIDLSAFGFADYAEVSALISRSGPSTTLDLAEDQSIIITTFTSLDADDFIL